MQTAARVGERFALDPLIVLGGRAGADELEETDNRATWLIRAAALRVCHSDDARARRGR